MNTIIKSLEGVKEWFSIPRNILSLDTETTSLSYLDVELDGISLSDGTDACYIDWSLTKDKEILEYLDWYINEFTNLIIMHNAPYDLMVLHKYNINIPENIFCTMTAYHLINECNRCGLKHLAETLLGIKDIIKYDEAAEQGHHTKGFYKYATNDAIWTYQLYQMFKKQIRRQELEYVMYKVEMPFQFVLRDLAINGLLINIGKLQDLIEDVSEQHYKAYKELYDTSGTGYSIQLNMFGGPSLVSKINLNNHQTDAEIIQKLGFEIWERTDAGRASAGKFTLQRLAGKHPFIDALIKYRQYEVIRSNFTSKIPNLIQADNRIRPGVNNCVTVTGRLSYSKPNLQGIPRADSTPVDVRQVFIPPTGYKMLAIDYAGQEIRILAHISRDKSMINALKNGLDLHLTVANKFFKLGIPEECLNTNHKDYKKYHKKFKHERTVAKTITFGLAYGKTATGFAADLHMEVKEVEKLLDAYFKAYPSIKTAVSNCHKILYRRKFVANMSGRRRRFTKIDNRAKRQAFNFLIQGFAADMIKIGMSKLRKFYESHIEWNAKIILTVHDEVVVEVKEEYAEVCLKDSIEVMENAIHLCVPIVADGSIGNNYSEAK